MTLPVVVRPLAELDLIDTQEWYEERGTGLGVQFRLEVDRVVGLLAESPSAFPVVYRGVRRAVLRRFPYLLYFVVTSEHATIVACLHMARGPRALQHRAPG